MKTSRRDSSDKHSFNELPLLSKQQTSASRRRSRYVVACLLVLAAVAVSLGVGLGVGLTKKHPSDQSPSVDNGTTILAQPSSNFVLKGAQAMANEPPQDRFFDFVVEERTGAPDGYQRTMLVVNGMFPGPTIEVNSGDRILVNVTNKLSNSTAIHWHGLYQRGTPYYDGTNAITQCGIPPGQSMLYNFTLDGWVGTTWWHAHHGTQYSDGVSGAFVVHAQNETVPATDGDIVLSMGDWYHEFSDNLVRQYLSSQGITGQGNTGTTQANEPVPDSGTINGVGQWGADNATFAYFNMTLEQNKTYRLRLINAGSFAAIRFSIDGHPLTIVEADGTAVEPYEVAGLSIHIAQRYSVLLRTNQTNCGAFFMRATVDQSAFTYDQPGFNGNQLGVMRYGSGVSTSAMPDMTLAGNDPGPGATLPDLNTWNLVPADQLPVLNSTLSFTLTVSMQQTSVNGQPQWLSFVNSTSWTPLANAATLFQGTGNTAQGANTYDDGSQFIMTVQNYSVVDLIVNNYDDGAHPLHLHMTKFWVLGSGNGKYQGSALNTVNPMRRDTQVFQPYSWTVLRFVADNPGMLTYHCHITWHMAAGLLAQFNVLPEEAAKLIANAPPYLQQMCSDPSNGGTVAR